MGIIYISGGARSGKSSFAENMSEVYEKKLYIATAKVYDKEMEDRVEKHKERRAGKWKTEEAYRDLDSVMEKYSEFDFILIDCITNMVTNIMLEYSEDWDNIESGKLNEIEEDVKKEIEKIIKFSKKPNIKIAVVSNELGMGLVPVHALGRHFRDIAGRVNQILAKSSDEAYFMVSGLEMKIK